MMKKKKAIKNILIIVAILLAVGGTVFFLLLYKKSQEGATDKGLFSFGLTDASGNEVTASADMFAVYGITSVDSSEVTFPVDGMTSSLEIEEIYVNTGDTVSEVTAILKFTDESVETVREELTAALRTKELAYRAAKIEYEQNKITYAYDEKTTELEGKQAGTVYNETIATLSSSVDKAKKTLAEANEKLSEYEEAMKNNSYYEEYVNAQAVYDEDLAVIKEKLAEWGVSWEEITRGVRENYSTLHDQYVTILSKYYSVLEADAKAVESAQTAYEESTSTLAAEMEMLKLSIPGLEADYANAQKTYDTSILEAKLTKEQTINKADSASKEYETNIEKAKADYEQSEDDYLDAKEALDTFEKCAGTGTFYATEKGNIIRTNARKGRSITSGSSIYTVSNPESMTVSVSIGQENIAKISVGDSSIVYLEDSGTYSAVIKTINPVSSSNQGLVTYSVTLEMTGNFTGLSANETVTVYLGMGGLQQ
ncbi:MAG: HlyD family efflux transporter periplasmic adaptor subunit [Lachnospiraceae bacterium]|nr:HlyD family efflux transporter periplasmic adaptor subunit [Lachnospiraceae bacterium]